ncbi:MULTISPECIES: LysE family translocator [Brevibacillus]|uniref:Lysine transporter LysE n=1 Tax=Brevibacillus parabrevis TaxID=54914 RepID=A0A4Y3PLU9_BREPA|nr:MULTISPECIES: LysE family translocator [Brevibacillus]MBU8712336.1 LysE family translocator [Brevibacillus parabrevis]MDH6349407.1 threonine/homoserine/homoserine lactone efflux protein [Brevibacillus sp. 1238]MDR5002563.1 LysE family translocator [Brevibacillus parabrevis]MED2257324.1 LysE family translocator [Brevibacillus parabrevis]NRQ52432.1 LysE family translocator [Brevibacillus sp. HD1.4A]
MFDLATMSTFLAVVIGLFLIPGPAVLLTATRTVQGGRRAGIMAGLGIATGDFIHTIFAAVGLSAILMTSAWAFNIVKIAGAVYLVYLGIKAIMEKPSDPQLPKVSPLPPGKAYMQAIVAELLNPKTALFFLAFLPQFVHPERGASVVQFLILGLIFAILGFFYTTLIALSVRPLGHLVKRISWLGRWSGKIIGSVYILLGLKVALQQK